MAQGDDRIDDKMLGRAVGARTRGPVSQTGEALCTITRDPFSHRPQADACGSCGGPRRLPARDLHDDSRSTDRRQTGILANVHLVPLMVSDASQP
jgi:hypothetical protein